MVFVVYRVVYRIFIIFTGVVGNVEFRVLFSINWILIRILIKFFGDLYVYVNLRSIIV